MCVAIVDHVCMLQQPLSAGHCCSSIWTSSIIYKASVFSLTSAISIHLPCAAQTPCKREPLASGSCTHLIQGRILRHACTTLLLPSAAATADAAKARAAAPAHARATHACCHAARSHGPAWRRPAWGRLLWRRPTPIATAGIWRRPGGWSAVHGLDARGAAGWRGSRRWGSLTGWGSTIACMRGRAALPTGCTVGVAAAILQDANNLA